MPIIIIHIIIFASLLAFALTLIIIKQIRSHQKKQVKKELQKMLTRLSPEAERLKQASKKSKEIAEHAFNASLKIDEEIEAQEKLREQRIGKIKKDGSVKVVVEEDTEFNEAYKKFLDIFNEFTSLERNFDCETRDEISKLANQIEEDNDRYGRLLQELLGVLYRLLNSNKPGVENTHPLNTTLSDKKDTLFGEKRPPASPGSFDYKVPSRSPSSPAL